MTKTEIIKEILFGIDLTQSENDFGWWETSTGSSFGKERLEQVLLIVSDLEKELEVTDSLLSEREKLLDAIPECSVHGKCIPHALEWINKMNSL